MCTCLFLSTVLYDGRTKGRSFLKLFLSYVRCSSFCVSEYRLSSYRYHILESDLAARTRNWLYRARMLTLDVIMRMFCLACPTCTVSGSVPAWHVQMLLRHLLLRLQLVPPLRPPLCCCPFDPSGSFASSWPEWPILQQRIELFVSKSMTPK